MTHVLLSRAHLEACLVALAIVRVERRREVLERVDRDRITPACWALLAQLADPACDDVHLRSIGQRRLADHAEAVTIADLTLWPAETLLALVNRLPQRAAPPAWERDLARATGTAA